VDWASRPTSQVPLTFSDDSPIRRVGGEPAMWLGAQRALLLQIAHPSVAAAVDRHSAFRQQPHRRLWSTADTVLAMVWGRVPEANAARDHVHAIHDHIHGGLPDETPPWHRDDAYTAHDPVLLRWVWSTLVDTSGVVYARFVGALTPDERDALYADWITFATFFGIPDADLPPDRHAFAVDYERTVASLVVTPTARRVKDAILDPPLWWAPGALRRLGATFAVALLPPQLRDGYRLTWSADDQRRADRLARLVRRHYPALPSSRTRLPYLYMGARRATRRRTGQSRPINVE
jgi:uncharacterized protein (DUF2236 family)